MSDALTDVEIVRGLRHGDRRAWEALCKQYSRRVWVYVARLIGGDEEAVADVYQETLLAVAKSGRTISEDSKLWPWLAAIGHNQSALYWRKVYAARRVETKAEALNKTPADEPLNELLRAETVELVRSLLADMNADSVALLTGKYLDGLTVMELVDLMGGTQESVRSKLARARRDFRSRYEASAKTESTKTLDNSQNSAVPELSPREGDFS